MAGCRKTINDFDMGAVEAIMDKVHSGVGRITDREEQMLIKNKLTPAARRTNVQWVIDLATERGLRVPTIEEYMR